jgi:hypothetical protein
LWPAGVRLLPHALAATQHAEQLQAELLATASLLDSASGYLHGRAQYADARRLRERALAIREAKLGPDHPDTAWSLTNLATVLRDQGDLAGARRLQERVVAIRDANLDPDHPGTARSRRSLPAMTGEL